MLKFITGAAGVLALSYAALFVALQMPLVHRTQPLSVTQPVSQLANPNEALTFALSNGNQGIDLHLVTEQTALGAKTIDLTALSNLNVATPFQAIDFFGHRRLVEMVNTNMGKGELVKQEEFLPVATGLEHVSFGTNFLSHGKEVNNETPFRFPRLTIPTASQSVLNINPNDQLIDYEVEICMSFDRAISTMQEFEDARKAVFLCGDFTDRKRMLDNMPDNENTISGIGFTDAKSIPGFFPTGPYVVVPNDWRDFIEKEQIGTSLNGQSMQIGSGDQMILKFDDLVKIALTDGMEKKWMHKNNPVPLLRTGRIEEGQVLLSGTTEGVLFRPPSLLSKIVFGTKYVMTGRFFTGESAFRSVVNDHIQEAINEKVMLMPGDEVVHHSSRLGKIATQIR